MRVFIVGSDLSIRSADTLLDFATLKTGEEFEAETEINGERVKIRVKKEGWSDNAPYAGFLAKIEAKRFKEQFEGKSEF